MVDRPLTLKQRFKLSRFFKGEAPVKGAVELTQRRVFILPTRGGLGMVATILLLLLVAFVYNNNLAYMLAFLLASVFFVSILHTYKGLAGLVVQAGYAQPVFAGDAAGFVVTVGNPGLEARMALSATLENELVFDLAANESKNLTLYAATRNRGWQAMDTVTLASLYPLGIFRAWSPLRLDGKVLVYPKPSAYSVPFPEAGGNQHQGLKQIDRTGRDDFNGIRSYQAGDSLRQIHWKAYAKGQGLMSKHYASQVGSTELWLDYEHTPGSHIEERLSQLCRWVMDAEQENCNYGLLLPGKKLGPDRGPKHLAACLEALALF